MKATIAITKHDQHRAIVGRGCIRDHKVEFAVIIEVGCRQCADA